MEKKLDLIIELLTQISNQLGIQPKPINETPEGDVKTIGIFITTGEGEDRPPKPPTNG